MSRIDRKLKISNKFSTFTSENYHSPPKSPPLRISSPLKNSSLAKGKIQILTQDSHPQNMDIDAIKRNIGLKL